MIDCKYAGSADQKKMCLWDSDGIFLECKRAAFHDVSFYSEALKIGGEYTVKIDLERSTVQLHGKCDDL